MTYVPRQTDRRLGMSENPKPDAPTEEAPNDCWIRCVGGFLSHEPPADWIDFEGAVHYVQAGAPNVLSVEEARLIVDNLHQPLDAEAQKVAGALWARLADWAEEASR